MESDVLFERSFGDETAARSILIGSSLYLPYVAKCYTEKPITCSLPGVSIEVLKLLAPYYNAQFDLVSYPGYGFGYAKEGNTTIMRSLVDGAVHAAGPSMWYLSERVANLPNFSFPLNTESLCAVMIGNSTLIESGVHEPLDAHRQGPIWAALLIIGLLLYFANWFIEAYHLLTLWFARHLLNMNIFLHSVVILLYLNFVASTIAITMFHPAPNKLPFHSFDEMADSVMGGHIKLVGIKNAATSRFTSPGMELAKSDKTLMKFYQANEQGRVTNVPTMGEAFDMIKREEDRAFIVNLYSAQANSDICDFEIITDLTFPKIPYGFFYSNLSTDWFYQDPALMGQLGQFFQHYVKHYTYPTRCVKMRPRTGLNLKQVEITFYTLAAGFIAGFISFLWELIHKTPAQKAHALKQKHPALDIKRKHTSSRQLPDRFIKDYYVKHIVDGGYYQCDEVWICMKRKFD